MLTDLKNDIETTQLRTELENIQHPGVDYRRVYLTMAFRSAIYDLDEPLQQVLLTVLDTIQSGEPLVLTEVAEKIGGSYATVYDRFGRGLEQIARKLAKDPEIADWLTGTAVNDEGPDEIFAHMESEGIVARVLKVFHK